jgi:EmrB/QacA subfamily drug resistance transporter
MPSTWRDNGRGPAVQGPPRTGDSRRWLILGVIGLAQLMVVVDVTVVNIALPSAQRSLHFSATDRQWVITAYALAFGSLLLLGGRLADLLGRRRMFLIGLLGFAGASAVGGAATSFGMLVAARACQGMFGAVLAPTALSLLTITFSDPKERGKAFGVFGAIAVGGGALGLLLSGLLTEYLSWRWCLYVNVIIAVVAVAGARALLDPQAPDGRAQLDLPGVVSVAGAMFCVVYGLSNAATHGWHSPWTWGFLAAGTAALAVFAWWQTRAASPLLPPRVVLDRTRGAACLAVLVTGIGMFGTLLFLTYYLQNTLGYSPVASGAAFLPMTAAIIVSANVATRGLMHRTGPRPLITAGLLIAAAAMVWLTRIGVHSGYASAVLPPLLSAGLGLGMVVAPSLSAATYGVAPSDAGVASASVNMGQQLGGSVGTALLNTMAASAAVSYAHAHLTPGAAASGHASAVVAQAAVHGYTTAFWWSAGIFAAGAVLAGSLLRSGPLPTPAGPPAGGARPAGELRSVPD